MSLEITTAFVEQYGANIHTTAQQQGSRFMGSSRTEQVVGKNKFFERIGPTQAQRRTTRHGDTPLMNTPHSRRRVSLADYDWADLVDDLDMVRTLIDPTNAYVQAGGMSMGRSMDDVFIDAALGSAWTGADGSTEVTFPAGQQLAAGTFTVARLAEIKELFDANEYDEVNRRYIAVGSRQIRDILGEEKATSADYATLKALVAGDIDAFMGFTFIRSERLAVNGSSQRRCFAWAENAMILGLGATPVARVSERPDKNHSTQVYYSMAIGAVRMEEVGVVELPCTEA